MKQNDFKRVIMKSFIVHTIGIAITLLIFEFLFSLFTIHNGMNFSELASSPLIEDSKSFQIFVSILWNLISIAVYFIWIALFGRKISKKIIEPLQVIEDGFKEVTTGHLTTLAHFETENEFAEMRESFNYMVLKLKEAEEKRVKVENEKMELFSHIAHDLKTPMTTISGYAGALANGLVEDLDKQQEYYFAIQAKSGQMNQLIDQLLSYSKLGTSQYKMNFKKIDLVEFVRVSCASMFGEMEHKQMKLELALPDTALFYSIDSFEMNRAIGNLLTNAIRHNPIGSRLYVGIKDHPESLEIAIADDGIPIPEELAGNLFEPFVSGDRSRSANSGTGLGLAIVKRVMEQHNGEVFLTGAPSPYTKMFVLKFPKK